MTARQVPGIRPLQLSRRKIIEAAEELSLRYVDELGTAAYLGMNFDLMFERVVYPDNEIILREGCSLGYDLCGLKVLGRYNPLNNTVFIDAELCVGHPRRIFTLNHEVGGHAFLQGEWLRSEFRRIKRELPLDTTEVHLDVRTENTLEYQANIFAAHMAAPDWLLDHWIKKRFRTDRPFRYIGPSGYCLDVAGKSQHHTIETVNDLCRIIALKIAPFFGGLSVESLSYRIEERGWIVDETQPDFFLHRTDSSRAVAWA